MTTTLPVPPLTPGAPAPAPRPRSRGARLLLGAPGDPVWVRPALVALLLLTGLLYLWGLGRNGWANAFYSAAVQAGSASWKAFFFGSSDAAGAGAGLTGQLLRFAAVGVASALAYLGLYALLRLAVGPQWANLEALLVTAIANTAANRRLTFGVRGTDGAWRHQIQGLLVFAVGLALTSGALALLAARESAAGRAGRIGRPDRRQPARGYGAPTRTAGRIR